MFSWEIFFSLLAALLVANFMTMAFSSWFNVRPSEEICEQILETRELMNMQFERILMSTSNRKGRAMEMYENVEEIVRILEKRERAQNT